MGIDVQRTRYSPGFRSGWHSCEHAQLIYPSRGVMTLHLRDETWIVPPLRSCWLPALTEHDVETPLGLEMHSVYCLGGILRHCPAERGIVAVSDLLRAVILALERPEAKSPEQIQNLAAVFVDNLRLDVPARLHLPVLRSPRLAWIQSALRDDPGDTRTLADFAHELRVTPRTLAREFRRDACMSFTQYRTQQRLHVAIERLAANDPVTTIAVDLGFGSPSNFISMFRKATGMTPGTYFSRS